jgi:hypothetical protein
MGLSGGFHRCQGGTNNGWISGEIVAVRGEFRWPSAGSFSGRLWGLSHGRRHIGRLQGQERELLSLRYEDSISRELFAEEQRRIASDIAAAEREITSYELGDCDYLEAFAKATDLLRRIPSIYPTAPPIVRRQCNRAIFSKMYLRGPKVTGAVLTPLAAGLLESETGRTTWGVIPGDKPGEPSSDDGLENHFPSTIVFVDVGSRESS